MLKIKEWFTFWLRATRAYALGMTIMSWGVVFFWGLLDGGTVLLGLLCAIGLIFAHLGTNLLDDYLDYKKNTEIVKNLKEKCWFLKNNDLTLNQTLVAVCVLFLVASIIGLYLTLKTSWIVAIIASIAGILCLFYTKATYIGLGEVIVGLLFSPCLYLGTYYVMTKSFSTPLMLISISTALLTIAVLHTHTMMDFDSDKKDKKDKDKPTRKEKRAIILGAYRAYLPMLVISAGCLTVVAILMYLWLQ